MLHGVEKRLYAVGDIFPGERVGGGCYYGFYDGYKRLHSLYILYTFSRCAGLLCRKNLGVAVPCLPTGRLAMTRCECCHG